MARGDLTVFEEYPLELGKGTFDLSSDTLKLGLIDNTTPPTAADASPVWASYSGNEVSGSGYTAGGAALTGVTFTEASGVATLDDTANVTWTQNASGPTDVYWGILYDDTAASKNAICFIDFGGPVSLVDGNIAVTWNVSGIVTVSA